MEWRELHGQIEAILFAAGEPVSEERLCLLLEETPMMIEVAIRELMEAYRFERRGFRIVRLEQSYQMTSAPEYADTIRAMMDNRKPDKLSPSALEALSVVAYYQPVTRAYVEQVRGVDSTYTINLLLDRELIAECGRLEVPGKPYLYETTANFLRVFGLSSLEELPELPRGESGEGGGKQGAEEVENLVEQPENFLDILRHDKLLEAVRAQEEGT